MSRNIAIIAGGDSGEFEISVKSAAVVQDILTDTEFEVYLIVIRGTEWNWTDPENQVVPVDKSDFSLFYRGRKITFDCIFNAIHGTPGENGKILGYFDILGIPYTSCGQATSALTFNKYFCNGFVKSLGVKVPSSTLVNDCTPGVLTEIATMIGFPCFVKPNNGGSSVGASKVKVLEELESAIRRALQEDEQVLVETFIPGREITCGVVKFHDFPLALPITEVISKKEFFDYEAKYTKGMSEEITPADIPESISELCQSISRILYNELNCRGVVRFDYIWNDIHLYFLEVNTVPGLSPASIVPQQAKAAGISLKELFTGMIRAALEKH